MEDPSGFFLFLVVFCGKQIEPFLLLFWLQRKPRVCGIKRLCRNCSWLEPNYLITPSHTFRPNSNDESVVTEKGREDRICSMESRLYVS